MKVFCGSVMLLLFVGILVGLTVTSLGWKLALTAISSSIGLTLLFGLGMYLLASGLYPTRNRSN